MLKPGMYLQGRYEIIEKIGSGGMADVYKARCHTLNRLVAVKVLKEEFSSNESFVNRFKMEAQAAARLSHPNIVNVYDVIDEGDSHYIIMELIEGITLKSYIAKKGRLEVKETIGIAIQVAQGMSAAHQHNIIHRDIKPQNIIVSRDGKVKVADFGIARAASSNTQDLNAMGSVHYISPEQAKGEPVDARSDIYSLGITMFEMVTGRLPFDGENTLSVAMAHLENPITPPKVCNPDIPESLEQIILKCTEKRPEDRYGSAEEVIADLRRALINPYGNHPLASVKKAKSKKAKSHQEKEETEQENSSDSEIKPKPEKPRERAQMDISHQLERIFAVTGVVAAILIVAVLVFVVLRVGGLMFFRPSVSNPEGQESAVSQAQVTTAALADGQVYMPYVVGLSQEDARVLLENSGLSMTVSSVETSDRYPAGYVMAQTYPEGTVLERNTAVSVKVSRGTGTVDLTALGLEGMGFQAAKTLLTQKNLVVASTEENSDTIPAGNVISYSPQVLREGETVTLTVSSGPALIPVPDITGATPEAANALLTEQGFVPEAAGSDYSSDVEEGMVFNQTVAAGTTAPRGTVVQYTISLGPEETLIGKTHYIGSIDREYKLSLNYGPGYAETSMRIVIRLRQEVDGKVVYRNLIEPRTVVGDSVVPISFSRIEGADGVEEGTVELVDLDEDKVLVSYPVSFFKTEE